MPLMGNLAVPFQVILDFEGLNLDVDISRCMIVDEVRPLLSLLTGAGCAFQRYRPLCYTKIRAGRGHALASYSRPTSPEMPASNMVARNQPNARWSQR
jgi:hypothetical protein